MSFDVILPFLRQARSLPIRSCLIILTALAALWRLLMMATSKRLGALQSPGMAAETCLDEFTTEPIRNLPARPVVRRGNVPIRKPHRLPRGQVFARTG